MMTAGFRILSCVCSLMFVLPVAAAEEPHREYAEPPLDEHDRDHWSFQPIATAKVPDTRSDWCRTAIDHFVVARLSADDLGPQQAADRETLIRRLCFDLTGLPPEPTTIEKFLQDERPDAYTRLVDGLLNSPHFGERQAQHWLDLARFAETDGFEHDKVRSDAWRYRDWVIDAFNADMPYDEFVLRQLAGDEAYPDDESARTATRFCLSGPDMPDINLLAERRHSVLNELTSTVGEVFLGLQIGCAQCHDHKYDPISQADFYRLRAIFSPAVSLQKNRSLTTLKERFPTAAPDRLMLRGDFRRPGAVVPPAVPRVLVEDNHRFRPVASKTSAGLRSALARWLTSQDNPLTARVIVNRIWQSHFGTGLVDTPSEFGLMGSEPTHPELLDWLATSLRKDGWSLKQLHRRIVLSAVYRQRSRLPNAASDEQQSSWMKSLRQDPTAAWLSRFPRRRLDGEAIRDAMLLASGRINRQAKGPGIRPPLPQELVQTLLRNQWNVTADPTQHDRRSIYVFARRNLRYPIFEVFDRPSANASCAVRGRSTTAPQSLHLLNSRFSLDMAGHLARRLLSEHEHLPQQTEAAFLHCLGRRLMEDERADVEAFIANTDGSDEERLTHLCLSLFNSNEFVFVD